MQGFTNRDAHAAGWINDYYAVRTFDPSETVTLPNSSGAYTKVEVQVYFGGNSDDGTLEHRLFCHQILLEEYKP